MLDLILLIVVCLAYFLLGAFVLVNNPKSDLNRSLAFLSFALVGWSVVTYLEDVGLSLSATRLLVRADFTLAVAVLWFFFGFCYELYGSGRRWLINLLAGMGISSIVLTITGHTVGIKISQHHVYFIPRIGYQLVMALAFLALAGGLSLLISRYRKSSGRLKAQIKLIFYGMFLTSLLVVITNVILPNLMVAPPSITRLGIYGNLLFISLSAYTIFKHRFLDIRVLVARSVAYIFLTTSMAAVFILVLLSLSAIFLKDDAVNLGVKIAYVAVALIMAILYQPLKSYFDKFSNRLFYRDAYDPQEVLDKLNSSLVTNIEIDKLLTTSAKIIKDMLKLEFCMFAIHGVEGEAPRLVKIGGQHITEERIEQIKHHTEKGDQLIVTDELDSATSRLKELLRSNNIGAVVKLKGSQSGRSPSPGLLVLGQKSSGSIYADKDIKIIDILADELVIAIQNSLRFEEISQFNITLRQKIEEATRELRSANKRLRDLDAAKDEFISMASHQLRTPLTSVKGYLSMTLDGDAGKLKMEQAELLQHAFDSAQRMVYLISDLLNVSRLQTGKFVIENKPTNLAEVVVGELDQLKDQAANREITMEYDKPDKFPVLNLDETKIRQVIMNFLDNALYYTPKGGHIKIAVTASPQTVELTVTDSGIGVPKSAQHQLFGKFYRADNARVARPDGTGLGLFMAKKVVVAQGGAIIFRSTEGKGSTFGFSLPRKSLELNSA